MGHRHHNVCQPQVFCQRKSCFKKTATFIIVGLLLLLLDQLIKFYCISLANPRDIHDFVMIAEGKVISLALVYNTGVAFSFLTSLGEWLKFIQVGFLVVICLVLYLQRQLFLQHYLAFACMLSGGISNVLDRFLHGGVVDYIYWHYGFDFPIFNFADICIDCGIALFLWQTIRMSKFRQ
ncbi:lipoprotein signal peptidase [Helicobacter aurati]|uniref:Lipoprotein signal peptidase n=1 Tax=Helicobacter aurati TaxID=137778 RepID=A0A3D8J7P1_9HELI|nr:signal peptidase II [Helicobacter aurati]RDU72871.1 lipoprotein signal peptidase [Helicobacter aurati]